MHSGHIGISHSGKECKLPLSLSWLLFQRFLGLPANAYLDTGASGFGGGTSIRWLVKKDVCSTGGLRCSDERTWHHRDRKRSQGCSKCSCADRRKCSDCSAEFIHTLWLNKKDMTPRNVFGRPLNRRVVECGYLWVSFHALRLPRIFYPDSLVLLNRSRSIIG